MRKCFACNKKLSPNPYLVDTKDNQHVFVGSDCFRKIKKSGELGYQPPLGGPRLFTLEMKGYSFLETGKMLDEAHRVHKVRG